MCVANMYTHARVCFFLRLCAFVCVCVCVQLASAEERSDKIRRELLEAIRSAQNIILDMDS